MKQHEGKSARKPYNQDKGYVTMRGCDNPRGHLVIYDRTKGYDGPGERRFVLVHKPSGVYLSFDKQKDAREAMARSVSFGLDLVSESKRIKA